MNYARKSVDTIYLENLTLSTFMWYMQVMDMKNIDGNDFEAGIDAIIEGVETKHGVTLDDITSIHIEIEQQRSKQTAEREGLEQ